MEKGVILKLEALKYLLPMSTFIKKGHFFLKKKKAPCFMIYQIFIKIQRS